MANDYPFIMMPVSIFSENLSAADYKVFGTLASYTRADRVCHVFANTIAAKAGLGRRSVFKSLSKLEQLGYIRRQNEINKGFSANYYYIDFNPLPSEQKCTRVVQKNTLPSEQKCTQEVDLKEVYLNSKNLRRARAKKSKEGLGELPKITPTDKQILADIQTEYPDVYLWAKIIKTNIGLSIKPMSALGERNISEQMAAAAAEMAERYGVNLSILPANSNVINSREVE